MQISKSCLSIPSESKSRNPVVPNQTPINSTMLSNVRNLSPKTISNLGHPNDFSVITNPIPPNPNTSNNKGPELLSSSPRTSKNIGLNTPNKTAKSLILSKHESEKPKILPRTLSEQSKEDNLEQSMDNLSNKANLNSKFDNDDSEENNHLLEETSIKFSDLKMTPHRNTNINFMKSDPNTSQAWKSDPREISDLSQTNQKEESDSTEQKQQIEHEEIQRINMFPQIGYHPQNIMHSIHPQIEQKKRRTGKMIPINDEDEDDDEEFEKQNKHNNTRGIHVIENYHNNINPTLIQNSALNNQIGMIPRGTVSSQMHLGHLPIQNLGGYSNKMVMQGMPIMPINLHSMGMRYNSFISPQIRNELMKQGVNMGMPYKEGQMISPYSRIIKDSKPNKQPYYYRQQTDNFSSQYNQKRF